MSKLFDSILRDYDKQQEADALFTEALAALEVYDWDLAFEKSHEVLACSTNIEQRMAAIFMFSQAVEQNELHTSAWISIAYQHER